MWKKICICVFALYVLPAAAQPSSTGLPGDQYLSGTVGECKQGRFDFCGYNHNASVHASLAMFPGAASAQLSNFELMDRYLPFTQYLSQATKASIKLVPITSGPPAFKSLEAGQYAFFFGPPIFAARNLDKYEPLVRDEHGVSASVLVQSNSRYKSLADLGPSDKVGAPGAGLLQTVLVKGLLVEAGSKATIENNTVNSATVLADKCVYGYIQAFVISSKEMKSFMEKHPGQFREIAKSQEAPGFTLMARKDVEPALKKEIVNAIFKLQGERESTAEKSRAWKSLAVSKLIDSRPADYGDLVRVIAGAESRAPQGRPGGLAKAGAIQEARR